MATDVTVSVKSTASDMPEVRIDEDIIEAWIEERLNEARDTFVLHLSGGGGGRTYKGGHRASAPGQYPATDSGRLANSVDYQMRDSREGALFSDIEYATYLTDGTIHMAPRKMLYDAIEEVLGTRASTEALTRAVVIGGGPHAG
jgi:hypothetical protein